MVDVLKVWTLGASLSAQKGIEKQYPDQTASEIAVWSESSLFTILKNMYEF